MYFDVLVSYAPNIPSIVGGEGADYQDKASPLRLQRLQICALLYVQSLRNDVESVTYIVCGTDVL